MSAFAVPCCLSARWCYSCRNFDTKGAKGASLCGRQVGPELILKGAPKGALRVLRALSKLFALRSTFSHYFSPLGGPLPADRRFSMVSQRPKNASCIPDPPWRPTFLKDSGTSQLAIVGHSWPISSPQTHVTLETKTCPQGRVVAKRCDPMSHLSARLL